MPVIPGTAELLFDRELFSGRQIYDPHANWQTQGEQIGRYLMGEIGGQYGQYQRAETNRNIDSCGSRRESRWARRAPRKPASDIAVGKMDTEAEDPEDRANHVMRREILDQLRKGNRKPLEEAERKHELTHRQVLNLLHRSKLSPLEDTVHGFTIGEVEKVLEAAKADKNEEETKLLERILGQKQHRAHAWAAH